MKTILVLLIQFMIVTCASTQIKIKDITEIDMAIIQLNHAAHLADHRDATIALKNLDATWSKSKFKILDKHHCSPNEEMKVCTMSGTLASMFIQLEIKDFNSIKKSTLNAAMIFKEIKAHKELELDPVDILWSMYADHQNIHNTVHDLMFGLREWFEFEDMVNSLSKNLSIYSKIESSDIQARFPHIDEAYHTLQLNKINTCFLDFLVALESGYTPDFEWPCDELGVSIYNLLLQYADRAPL